MVGRSVDKKDEIRAYIKARSKLGCSLKKLMTEISTAFGPSCVSYDTVRRWKKKFESGVESIKNASKSGRPKSASRKEIVSKIKEIIEGDARFTVRDIARKVGISLSTQQTPNNCQTCFEYKEGFVCNLLLWWRSRNKSASEKGQKHHRKVLQRRSTEETEKVLSETMPCHWF